MLLPLIHNKLTVPSSASSYPALSAPVSLGLCLCAPLSSPVLSVSSQPVFQLEAGDSIYRCLVSLGNCVLIILEDAGDETEENGLSQTVAPTGGKKRPQPRRPARIHLAVIIYPPRRLAKRPVAPLCALRFEASWQNIFSAVLGALRDYYVRPVCQ